MKIKADRICQIREVKPPIPSTDISLLACPVDQRLRIGEDVPCWNPCVGCVSYDCLFYAQNGGNNSSSTGSVRGVEKHTDDSCSKIFLAMYLACEIYRHSCMCSCKVYAPQFYELKLKYSLKLKVFFLELKPDPLQIYKFFESKPFHMHLVIQIRS